MKALIICSLHALSDISQLERKACNRACERHGIPAKLSVQDHARILANTTMLDVLNHLPGSQRQNKKLIETYLDILNDEVWNTPISAHKSVFDTLLDPRGCARPTGFASDYPMLTTNLLRSSALLTNATKLGTVTALSDPLNVQRPVASIAALATSLETAHKDVEVLVAHPRDFLAAQSIGMHPRFIEELRPVAKAKEKRGDPRARISKGAVMNCVPIPEPAGA